ncbi:MAG: nucleotidyl transferase AbiEii/AbiGii toxin family protein [Chloroflexi bacterium]|nr:MAG: nucleotidyl transferase AbiEii/AbiGii toxin family protein [Chloroflexota bacterium]
MLGPALLEQVLQTLGAVLRQRGLSFEAVAIGGSSLMLLGFINRPTRDLDLAALVVRGEYVKADPLPADLAEAAVDVANALGLPANWLNSGPTSIVETGFPEGFASRVEVRRYGGLTLDVASRYDQIFLKLYAAADQWPGSKHADDLRRLEPTREELIAAAKWTMSQDPSEGFKQLLGNTLRELGLNDADSLL